MLCGTLATLAVGFVSPATSLAAPSDCTVRLQSLVDAAPAGGLVQAPACVYREIVTIDKPLTLDGGGKAEIRGSDVWSNWRASGTTWVSDLSVPALPYINDPGRCWNNGKPSASGNPSCLWPEQVFVDGTPYTQVAPGTTPKAREFALDGSRHVLLTDNPNGHQVEVSTRNQWVITRAAGVTIQNFTMKHAANDAQASPINNGGYGDWFVQNNVLSDAHGAVLGAITAKGVRILGNDISRGGQLGFNSYKTDGMVFRGNKVHDNNVSHFSYWWEAGGLKMATVTNVQFDWNEIYNNDGVGAWCDIHCDGATFASNRVHHNSHAGIFIEISQNVKVVYNAIWENAWPFAYGADGGISVSTSRNVEIAHNVLGWNAHGVVIFSENRGDAPANQDTFLQVHENAIISTADWNNPCGLCWWGQVGVTPMFSNGTGNLSWTNEFWWPSSENGIRRYGWNGNNYGVLSDFQSAGPQWNSYGTDASKSQALSAANIPQTPENHRRALGLE
jgi:hypothetical protein